jgi:hypothetical protein
MANLTPASNVQAATVAGFIAVLLEHLCAANDITIPPDVADALPGALIVLVAYIHDCVSSAMAAKQQISQFQASAASSMSSPPTS